ncbi:MAG TPA: glycosyltransferase family 2 protein [Thermoanaerobaculia bacterium]|nr:glycosyltransferase family 2 protein [Thermoanaerobaculia bacterium]
MSQPPAHSARRRPRISIVFSFYNEERVLPELIRRTRAVLAPMVEREIIASYHLIFVNDASTDGSLAVLQQQLGDDMLIVNTSRNFGVSECALAGFAYADGDAVVYLDADLQDPPEVIERLVLTWLEDPQLDVVYTTRSRRRGEHALKLAITKLGYRLINAISEVELPLDSGDFKLVSRRAVSEVLRLREQRPYLRGMVSWVGFKQAQVLYERDPRLDGRENTKFPVISRRVLSGYFDRALISFSDVPLKVALATGFAVSICALLYIITVLVQKVMGWYEPGWPALMSAILLLGGMQLSVLGIIGLYVNNIFLQSKQRPLYIVASTLPAGTQPFAPEAARPATETATSLVDRLG